MSLAASVPGIAGYDGNETGAGGLSVRMLDVKWDRCVENVALTMSILVLLGAICGTGVHALKADANESKVTSLPMRVDDAPQIRVIGCYHVSSTTPR